MSVATRVLDGLGAAFRRRAGDQLPPLVEGLTEPLERPAALVQPTARGWAAAFDLDQTPDPAWLGRATGTRVPTGLAIEQQRQLVRDRAQWRRGTPGAVIGAVQTLLGGTQRVDLVERDGSAGRLTVKTYAAETDVDAAAIVAAATTQKPVGIVISAEIVSGASYAHMAAEHGQSYEEYMTAFDAYPEAHLHVPELGTEA